MSQDFEQLLSDTRDQLNQLRDKPQPPPAPQTGIGRALDGKIEVEMTPDGRVSGLAIDPSALRLDERELARELIAAFNEAWAKRQGLDDAAAAVAALDNAALQRQLAQVQDQGVATMKRFTDTMQSVLDKLDARVPR